MRFKVGFLFIDEHSKVTFAQLVNGDFVFRVNKEKIIWSNELKVK
jgi:hypothetical protein